MDIYTQQEVNITPNPWSSESMKLQIHETKNPWSSKYLEARWWHRSITITKQDKREWSIYVALRRRKQDDNVIEAVSWNLLLRISLNDYSTFKHNTIFNPSSMSICAQITEICLFWNVPSNLVTQILMNNRKLAWITSNLIHNFSFQEIHYLQFLIRSEQK